MSASQIFETVVEDLRHSLRGLRKSPGFAAAVIVTLGLGIGGMRLHEFAFPLRVWRATHGLEGPR